VGLAALKRAVGALILAAGTQLAPCLAWADSDRLDEVLITARRREERLLDVPDSVTALTATTIQNAHITNVKDVALRVPNFSIVEGQQPGAELLNVRGVCQARNGDPPVAVSIDGVQVSNAVQISQALFDVEHIEVLKGPQGAVYGRNAIGGAINITTRMPTDRVEGEVRGGVGSDSDYTAGATLSGPLLDDKVSFRLAGDLRSFDGDIRSLNTPGRSTANEQDDRNVRLRVLAKPSDRLSVDTRVSRLDTKAGASWYTPIPPGGSPDEPRDYQGNFPGFAQRTLTDASVKADLRFARATLTSVSAFSTIETNLGSEADFTVADGSRGDQRMSADNWSQELRLTSTDSGAFHWLAGVYYLNTHQRLDTQIYLGADFLPLFNLPASLAPLLIAATRTTDDNDAYAAFGQASYRWPTNIELAVALRYDEDHRYQLDRSTPAPAIYEHTFDSLQPKVSLSYFLDPDRMVYVTAGKGFRSGGFNPQDRITRIYKAETNLSYEAGWKSTLLDGRANLTAAAFYTRIRARQVYTLDIVNSAQTLSNPIPRARVHGFEMDITALPLPGLEAGASLGLTRSRIERYDTSVFAGLPVAGDFTGNKLPQTPEYSFAAYTQYRVPMRNGLSLTPRLEWQGCGGDFFWEIDNANQRAPLDFVNLRLSAQRSAWNVTAFLENALDEHYVLELLPQQWSGVATGDVAKAGRGRHWGLQASYSY
jgi:iron complex outermembrane receptor protein